MAVSNFIAGFNTRTALDHKEVNYSIKVDGMSTTAQNALCNNREVKSFIVAPWSNGAIAIEVFTK